MYSIFTFASTGACALALASAAVPIIAADDPDRPNIVVIYADDIGYGDFSSYGATAVTTPHVDSLAREGVRFLSSYATASVCTPSRYSLLTGEYAFRQEETLILPGDAPLLIDEDQRTLPKLLARNGYTTAFIGKWHLGMGRPDMPVDWNREIVPGPREVGFDYSFHIAATGDRVPSVYIENGRVVDLDADDPIEVSYRGPVGDEPTGISHPHLLKVQADSDHSGTIVNGVSRIGWMSGGAAARFSDEKLSDTFLEKAEALIEDASRQGGPFFLYYAAHENHVPRVPHPRFQGGSALGPRGDAIMQFDWTVGRIMSALDEHGLRENTLIILTSDNGPVLFDGYFDGALELNHDHRPAGPYRSGKYSRWEGGTRMPMIVAWPGRVKPGLVNGIISQVDFLASLAALTGSPEADWEGLDSQNLLPLLLGETDQGREHVVQEGMRHSLAIRSGDWKFLPPGPTFTRDDGGNVRRTEVREPGLLFYLPEDPREQRNLATMYPWQVERMAALLERIVTRGNEVP